MRGTFTPENISAAFILVGLLIAGLAILIVAVQPTMKQVEWTEATYTVKSGDTLWEIADKYCPDIVDKREWIAEVRNLNSLHNSTIHPGQQIKVLVPAA